MASAKEGGGVKQAAPTSEPGFTGGSKQGTGAQGKKGADRQQGSRAQTPATEVPDGPVFGPVWVGSEEDAAAARADAELERIEAAGPKLPRFGGLVSVLKELGGGGGRGCLARTEEHLKLIGRCQAVDGGTRSSVFLSIAIWQASYLFCVTKEQVPNNLGVILSYYKLQKMSIIISMFCILQSSVFNISYDDSFSVSHD